MISTETTAFLRDFTSFVLGCVPVPMFYVEDKHLLEIHKKISRYHKHDTFWAIQISTYKEFKRA